MTKISLNRPSDSCLSYGQEDCENVREVEYFANQIEILLCEDC